MWRPPKNKRSAEDFRAAQLLDSMDFDDILPVKGPAKPRSAGGSRRHRTDADLSDDPVISHDHTRKRRRGESKLLALRTRNVATHSTRGTSSSREEYTDDGLPHLRRRKKGDAQSSALDDLGYYGPKEQRKHVGRQRPLHSSDGSSEASFVYSEAAQDYLHPVYPNDKIESLDPSTYEARTTELTHKSSSDQSKSFGNGLIDTTITFSSSDEPEVDSRIETLKRQLKVLENSRTKDPWHFKTIYRVHDRRRKRDRYAGDARYDDGGDISGGLEVDHFLDVPRWTGDEPGYGQLEGTSPVSNINTYIERASRLAFVVFRDYDGAASHNQTYGSTSEVNRPGVTLPFAESVCFVSKDLYSSLRDFLQSLSNQSQFYKEVASQAEFQAPYLFVYHHRKELADFAKSHVPVEIGEQWSLFTEYVRRGFSAEYQAADEALSRGFVTRHSIQYLIKPGDVLISTDASAPYGYHACSWASLPKHPSVRVQKKRRRDHDDIDSGSSSNDSTRDSKKPSRSDLAMSWAISLAHWTFDSTFKWNKERVKISLSEKPDAETPITGLKYYPIRYADDVVVSVLRRRGETFWRCRTRKYVEIKEDGLSGSGLMTTRFMIDPPRYARLHKRKRSGRDTHEGDLSKSAWESDTPPNDPFVLLLPSRIKGFDMHRKKWVNLEVSRISDVDWNTRAFQSLVADKETKDLIEALVRNKLETQKATDLIDDKGNGLIILLHGGPGTGKTFTAESVAEIAQKPLYRVTCGDIGTNAEDVEEYLESVLYLGRIWGCVVLLDEADVFLEERTLFDLQRNALVSVFLRLLEYYSGILILTSNRVGTFDEAFKSRIQLILRYETFTPDQRHQIWQNFMRHIQTFDNNENIDFADITSHLSVLSQHEMNGRQIRNCITAGRQLAQFRNTVLNFNLLQSVIEVAGRFDLYLKDVKQAEIPKSGVAFDERVARDAGIR